MQLALTMKQEIEIKLLATPAALERLEASPWFGRRAKDASQQELISVYFDTPGLELREAGVTLRVRHVGTKRLQTIKSSLGALARVEAEQEIEGDAPDLGCVRAAALRPLGRKKKLARQLSPVFETCVTRTQFPLELPGGAVEVAIDRGEIRAGRSVEAISELEVELKAGSLGAAVELAKRRRVGAIVVEDTFTSLADMAGRVYPWLPARLLLRSRYASKEKIAALDVPVLVIHSRDDELIPLAQGRALFEAAREPKQFLEVRGPHNGPGFVAESAARAEVAAFLERHVAR